MSDDTTRESDQPQTQPGGAIASPPPPPPAPPTTGERPPEWHPEDWRRRRRGGLVGGLVLVFIGLILLGEQFFPGIGFDKLWPLILIVIGLAIIFGRR